MHSIAVLLTVKNNASTIKKCVKSLLSQSYKNYDIFIIDAFSDDGTYEILKDFAKRHRKIKLFQLKGWPPHAYNWVSKRIKSKYVAFIDGDCVADKDWLKELISGFSSNDILAVAGYCGTPENASNLQKLIGLELESRFKRFPKYIPRAPTMNLCVRTNIARKLKFDESLRVGYDADFGWRLTKLGKMLYNPKAKIWHYHRSTWRSYFKQQYITAKFMPRLYLKHIGKISGDHVSTCSMIMQPFLFYLIILSLILSVFMPIFSFLVLVFILTLFFLYLINMQKIGCYLLGYFPLFFIRTIAWSIGLIVGLFKF